MCLTLTQTLGMKVLWCHSHLVWLVFWGFHPYMRLFSFRKLLVTCLLLTPRLVDLLSVWQFNPIVFFALYFTVSLSLCFSFTVPPGKKKGTMEQEEYLHGQTQEAIQHHLVRLARLVSLVLIAPCVWRLQAGPTLVLWCYHMPRAHKNGRLE